MKAASVIKPPMWSPGRNGHDLWRGCVGYWPLWEGVGTNAMDLSGFNNHGTLMNMDPPTDWATGTKGRQLDFDGTSDYVDLGNNASLEVTLPCAIGCLINPSDVSGYRAIAPTDSHAIDYYGIIMNVSNTGLIGISYGDGAGSDQTHRRTKTCTTSMVVGNWYSIVCVLKGATDMNIYLNGVDDAGTYSGTGGAVAYSASPAGIGSAVWGNATFQGVIANCAVWNRALEPGAIAELATDPFCMIRKGEGL